MSTLVILALINVGIYQKEKILNEGDIILLKLQPIDPRSLIAGDYMAFRYKIAQDLNMAKEVTTQKHGFLVIKADEDNVGEFVRIYQGESLLKDEKLLKFTYKTSTHQFSIKPDSFLFQEGLQPLYQKAEYAILHYNGAKDYLLVGLADSKRNEINSLENENINAE
jgi:uncharacterized membrane-anchored protein